MKFSVQAELSDTEIRELAADAARRGVVWAAQEMGEALNRVFTPETTQSLFSVLGPVLGPMIQTMQQQMPRGPQGDIRRPWGRVGFFPSQNQQPPPGYGGGIGVPPGPFGPPPGAGYGPPGARVVVPMSGSGVEVKECFPIEETRQNEAGWGCCRCATSNSAQRSECRTCGHKRCGAVVTPTPKSTPAQVPGYTGVVYPPEGPPPPPPPIDDQPA